jgi:hypothetical protein
MPRKLKFKPQITRVKLNPEQAVLLCPCFLYGYQNSGSSSNPINNICYLEGSSTKKADWTTWSVPAQTIS